ncbi:MAG: ROK family protein [Steroidobacteraceae bacterium]
MRAERRHAARRGVRRSAAVHAAPRHDTGRRHPARRILAVDIGGTHVKVLASGARTPRKADSGPHLTPRQMVRIVEELAAEWRYEVISIGYPGVVWHGRPIAEPCNLGTGWVKFDYAGAFGRPVRVINDAAMQAIGSYTGGRMLFLGLGTGLGTALILNGVIEATELAHLPYRKGRTYEDYLGKRGLHRLGRRKWERAVHDVAARLTAAFEVESVVVGGGNAGKLHELPAHARLGTNGDAFTGAFRLWREENWVQPSGAPADRRGDR